MRREMQPPWQCAASCSAQPTVAEGVKNDICMCVNLYSGTFVSTDLHMKHNTRHDKEQGQKQSQRRAGQREGCGGGVAAGPLICIIGARMRAVCLSLTKNGLILESEQVLISA